MALEPSILNFAGPLGDLNERLFKLAKEGHQIVNVVNVGPPSPPVQTADAKYHFVVFFQRITEDEPKQVPVRMIGF